MERLIDFRRLFRRNQHGTLYCILCLMNERNDLNWSTIHRVLCQALTFIVGHTDPDIRLLDEVFAVGSIVF